MMVRKLLNTLIGLLFFPFITAGAALTVTFVTAVLAVFLPIIIVLLSLVAGYSLAQKISSHIKLSDYLTFLPENKSILGVHIKLGVMSLFFQPVLLIPIALILILATPLVAVVLFAAISIVAPYILADKFLGKLTTSGENFFGTWRNLLMPRQQHTWTVLEPDSDLDNTDEPIPEDQSANQKSSLDPSYGHPANLYLNRGAQQGTVQDPENPSPEERPGPG